MWNHTGFGLCWPLGSSLLQQVSGFPSFLGLSHVPFYVHNTHFVYPLTIFLFICLNFIYLIFGCIGSSLRCTGFSLRWLLLLQSTGSRRAGFSSCGSWALECRVSSCGARA